MTYNLTRETQSILNEHQNSPPSFSVQLYHDNWTLNSGPKFLYNSPAYTALFDDIKANRIPVDLLELFDAAKAPFYEGCMIVEIEEFSQPNSTDDSKETKPPEKTVTRVLLRPNSETLFADLCLLNQKTGSKWTDKDALEIEAKILLATSPPLCLDPDPRLGKIANSLYRVSLPRTPPPLRPKKRKAKDLESTKEDDATWNRKAKIIRFMDPKPTRSTTPSYRLLDHLNRMKASPLPKPQPTERVIGNYPIPYINPLDKMPATHTPTQSTTPQPQSQARSQTTPQPQPQPQLHPQPQPQPQTQSQPPAPPPPQSQSQSPAKPQLQPQPQPQLQSQSQPQPQTQTQQQTQQQSQSQPQPQSQPQLQSSQSQQPPRSTATPVVTAPPTPSSTETKKSTPKQAARRTQTPGDGTLGTPTPSATPVHSTPQPTPQHVRQNRPVSRPTSQSPHPTAAVVSTPVNGIMSSPRVVPSPASHAMAVAGNTAPSNSPRPPAQPVAQPPQGQPQPQLQNQQPRHAFSQQMKGQPAYVTPNMAANMQLYKATALAAQTQGQNPKAGVHQTTQGLSPQQMQQMFYMQQRNQAQAQAQAQAHAQGQGQALGQGQGVVQARYAAQLANQQVAQVQQQQQQQQQPQQQNGQAHPMSRTPMSAAAAGANGNTQPTSRSPMPNANGQPQHPNPQHFVAASGQLQQASQQQQQQLLAMQQMHYSQKLQHQQQQQQQQHHPGQTQDPTHTGQMFTNTMSAPMQMQLRLMAQAQAQAQAGGRAPGNYISWHPVAAMGGMAYQQQLANGQPHPVHGATVVAQAKPAQAQAQPQGAGAR